MVYQPQDFLPKAKEVVNATTETKSILIIGRRGGVVILFILTSIQGLRCILLSLTTLLGRTILITQKLLYSMKHTLCSLQKY